MSTISSDAAVFSSPHRPAAAVPAQAAGRAVRVRLPGRRARPRPPLVKWLLAILQYIVVFFLWIGAFFAVVFARFAILFSGRYPRGPFSLR